MKASSEESASCSPSTKRAYSSCSLDASVFLMLCEPLAPSCSAGVKNYSLFDLVPQSYYTTRSRIQHWSGQVNAQ